MSLLWASCHSPMPNRSIQLQDVCTVDRDWTDTSEKLHILEASSYKRPCWKWCCVKLCSLYKNNPTVRKVIFVGILMFCAGCFGFLIGYFKRY